MSSVPTARQILHNIKLFFPHLPKDVMMLIDQALDLMTREAAVRRAAPRYKKITKSIRKQVMELKEDPNYTDHQIANETGLRNAGRVSEIHTGKR